MDNLNFLLSLGSLRQLLLAESIHNFSVSSFIKNLNQPFSPIFKTDVFYHNLNKLLFFFELAYLNFFLKWRHLLSIYLTFYRSFPIKKIMLIFCFILMINFDVNWLIFLMIMLLFRLCCFFITICLVFLCTFCFRKSNRNILLNLWYSKRIFWNR